MHFLFGSAPKVQQSVLPTTSPGQQALLSQLTSYLGGQQLPSSPSTFGNLAGLFANTQYAAGLNPLQTSSLNGFQNIVNAYTGGGGGSVPGVSDVFGTGGAPVPGVPVVGGTTGSPVPSQQPGIVGYSGVPAGGQTAGQQVGAALQPDIQTLVGYGKGNAVSLVDPTQAYQKGVVQPLTEQFVQRTLPGIQGKYGAGAGGAFGSDAFAARSQSGNDLARTLAEVGSQYQLDAQKANQSAQVANANIAMGLPQALAQAYGAPAAVDTGIESLLQNALNAGGVQQQTEQAQLTGEYQDYTNYMQQLQYLLSLMSGTATQPTLNAQSIVSPGQTGLLAALLGSAGQGAGAVGMKALLAA